MSCYYTRVIREPEVAKSYGYNKVSRQELRSIVLRVQKPTHASDQSSRFPDGYFKHPIRLTSGYCERARAASPESRPTSTIRRAMSPKLLKSVVRRLQTPTLSQKLAHGYVMSEYEANPPTSSSGPKTAEENRKFLRRITRPTKSSQRRDLDAFWQEIESSEYFYMDFSDETSIGKEDLETIIERIRTPTVASEPSEGYKCPKIRLRAEINRDKLPLVSGLSRSKKVEDIVERLYRPNASTSSKTFSSSSAIVY